MSTETKSAIGAAVQFWGLFLAVLGLLSAQFSPAGFMPATDEDGTLVMKICTGGGPESRVIAADHPLYDILAPDGQDDTARDKHCDFGASSAAADLPKEPGSTFECVGCAPLIGNAAEVLTGIFPAALPPATGPPFNS